MRDQISTEQILALIISILSERAREFIEATPGKGTQPRRSAYLPTAPYFT